jgi:predicted Fe-Mo cluster-binding NifX family protein
VVLDVVNYRIVNKECREVPAEPPGRHGHHHHIEEDDRDPEHARWHLAVLNTLKDVDVVVAFHMGPTMLRALEALGKRVLLGVYASNVEELIEVLRQHGL